MTARPCDYSGETCWRRSAIDAVAKVLRSQVQSHFHSLVWFTYLLISVIYSVTYSIYKSWIRLYLGCTQLRSEQHSGDADQTLPAGFQSPSLPRSGDVERPSWGHSTPCSHSEKPHCCSILITHAPPKPLYNSTAQPEVRGQVLLNLFLFYSSILRTWCHRGENAVWVCSGSPRQIIHFWFVWASFTKLSTLLVSCDCLKHKNYLFRKPKLVQEEGIIPTTTEREWIGFCQAFSPPKHLQET